METGTKKLRVQIDEGIALLSFDDPATRNALSTEVRVALPKVLEALQADSDIRVVVLTGAGGKAFMSGGDIAEFREQRTTWEARAAYDELSAATSRAWDALDKPTIAMICGYCIGGGLLMALRTDIRVASNDSLFAIPAARLGLGYGFEGVRPLVELIGPAYAAEMLFSARRLSADEARQVGLVNRVVERERVHTEVMELARSIAKNAPLTLRACKAALREARREPHERDLARVADLVEACYRSNDYLEGQSAFLEKRPPQFTGT